MESPYYGYYYISTDCISNILDTRELESFLLCKKCFSTNGMGFYKHQSNFLTLQLLLVKDYNSWSSNDYNRDKTNYIDIITSKKLNTTVKQFFRDLEMFIGWKIIEETEND